MSTTNPDDTSASAIASASANADNNASLMKKTGPSPSLPKRRKKRDVASLRKAPQAPKRFKSSYICFFTAKQSEIKEVLGDRATIIEISKRSAQMWKVISAEDRSFWDSVAARDKKRYMTEKASYNGPWHIPYKRAKKDPTAPKRTMSAFFHFAQGRRSQIKEKNPEIKNTEVSKILGDIWRKYTEEERRPYVENEKAEREKYKVAMAKWKVEFEKRKKEEKKQEQEQYYQPPPSQQQQQQQQRQSQSQKEYTQKPGYVIAGGTNSHINHAQNVQRYSQDYLQSPSTGYTPFQPHGFPQYPSHAPPPSSYHFNGSGGGTRSVKDQPVLLDKNGMPHNYQIPLYLPPLPLPLPPPREYIYTHIPRPGNNGYEDNHTPSQEIIPNGNAPVINNNTA